MNKYRALKAFTSDTLGHVPAGSTFEATCAQVGGVTRFVKELEEPKETPNAGNAGAGKKPSASRSKRDD